MALSYEWKNMQGELFTGKEENMEDKQAICDAKRLWSELDATYKAVLYCAGLYAAIYGMTSAMEWLGLIAL